MDNAAIGEALARIEQRQAAYETVARNILDTLEVHTEKLDAILEAAAREPGPSPVAEALTEILAAIREQTALLAELPASIASTIRELDADEEGTEPAGPGSFTGTA